MPLPEIDDPRDALARHIAFLSDEMHTLVDQGHTRDPHLFRLGNLLIRAETAYYRTGGKDDQRFHDGIAALLKQINEVMSLPDE